MGVGERVQSALASVVDDRSPSSRLRRSACRVLLGLGTAIAVLAGALAALPGAVGVAASVPSRFLYESDPALGSIVFGLVMSSAAATVLSARLLDSRGPTGVRAGLAAAASGLLLEALNSALSPASAGALTYAGKVEELPQAGLVLWWGLMVCVGSAIARPSARPVRSRWGRPVVRRVRIGRPRPAPRASRALRTPGVTPPGTGLPVGVGATGGARGLPAQRAGAGPA